VALERAWSRVRENGARSRRDETRDIIREFDAHSRRRLTHIANELKERRFEFAPQTGFVKRKDGKGRPLVVGPVPNRIVQRAILDQLLSFPDVRALHETTWSFGGVPGRDRRAAFREFFNALENGARWYARSDISNFFGNIPREPVMHWVRERVRDPEFVELFGSAIEVNLANLDTLGDDAMLFPLEDGVAQGSPLSPIVGNVLLNEFDRRMNERGIVCLRYIDDFLILGREQRSVLKAFESAQRMLKALSPNLYAYDPRLSESKKATFGLIEGGVDFLGCTLHPGQAMPSRSARRAFMASLDRKLTHGLGMLQLAATTEGTRVPRKRLAQIISDLDNVSRGWIDAVRFCTDASIRDDLDHKIDERLARFDIAVRRLLRGATPAARRRIRGLQLLADRPYEPIVTAKGTVI